MKVYNDFDLTPYNSYRLNAHCRTAYFPETDEDIITLFKSVNQRRIVLGGGYNVILTKDYYEEDFVIFSAGFDNMYLDGEDKLICEAGCDMKNLSLFALENSLSGLEIFYDIPSSLGGAIFMNAGAQGEDIKSLLINVQYFNPQKGIIDTLQTDNGGFAYRNSYFQKNPEMIICRAVLQLRRAEKKDIKMKMETLKDARWAKQPRLLPNAGSVFKRPPDRFVGPMIDELGLKGLCIGGAKISEKHSGFIVNFNQAKGSDIVSLITYIKSKVKEKYGITLEVEQRLI